MLASGPGLSLLEIENGIVDIAFLIVFFISSLAGWLGLSVPLLPALSKEWNRRVPILGLLIVVHVYADGDADGDPFINLEVLDGELWEMYDGWIYMMKPSRK